MGMLPGGPSATMLSTANLSERGFFAAPHRLGFFDHNERHILGLNVG
jgi:hypothetical protein